MQRRKSRRHVIAAQARWRAAEARAEQERADGIPDRTPPPDMRQDLHIDLTSYGGRYLRIEPRRGYVSVRVVDADSGEVIESAALKTALHRIADSLPRTIGIRSLNA